MSSINRRRVPHHTILKSNFDRLLYIIFFITQIHSLFSLYKRGGIESKALKKKKIWKELEKNLWKKILETKFWKKNVETKTLGKKFEKKNVGKINYKTKIFITKIYSNIDKCHTIFSLLAPYVKTGRKAGKTSVIYDSKEAVSLALIGRKECGVWTKSGEKIYHGLRAVGNSLTTWAISLHWWYEILVMGLPPRWSAEHWVPQKSRMLCISSRTVSNSPVLIRVHRL